jgi:hypothetical protein
MRGLLLLTTLTTSALLAGVASSSVPQFAEGNQLLRPQGYREWVFLSSGLGGSYTPGSDHNPAFTNVFIRPEAYREYVRTGEFPDGTVMVLEIRRSESAVSINKGRHVQGRLVGIEASVKDGRRFPEKWAYFSFIGDKGEALPKAKPFPKEACWSCHHQHGEVDNVFVQFYPGLREAREKSAGH